MKHIAGHDFVSLAIRMDAVGLHHIGMLIDIDQQKRQEAEVIFLRQRRKHGGERADIIGAIIRRQCDAQKNDWDVGLFEADDHFFEILFRGFNRNAT